jgi:hypothetical protein
LNEVELTARGGLRCRLDAPHEFPCRISLTDAAVGDEVLLINYEHLPVDSPYRSRHAIYVRAGEQTWAAVGEVPDMLRRRLLSLRAFDDRGDVADGRDLESGIERLLENPHAAYLHLHFARPGCYAARVERA